MHTINYNRSEFDLKKYVFKVFSIRSKKYKNSCFRELEFWKALKDNFHATSEEKADAKKLENYYYEYFIVRVGAAPYRGFGSALKKLRLMAGTMEWHIEYMDVA